MIRNDYILRLIEMFGIFARRISRRFEVGELEQVEGDLDETCRQFTGLSFSLLRDMELSELERLFGMAGFFEFEKLYVVACMFQEEARLAALTGNEVRAFHSRCKALELHFRAYREMDSECPLHPYTTERVDSLIPELADYILPPDLALDYVRYLEKEGRLAQAEDALHRHLRETPEFKETARAFYDRLLDLDDAVLLKANLPREEILEAKAELDA